MLNFDEFIIIYIILNYKINKQVTHVISSFTIINWIMFEFVISDLFIMHVMFDLTNTIEDPLLTRSKHDLQTRTIQYGS